MAVGLATFPKMLPVSGFRLGTVSAEIKYPDRKDLVLMEIAPGATISGVFTRNRFCAAPVQICQAHLTHRIQHIDDQAKQPFFLITNTGYANAGTGLNGHKKALSVCETVANIAGVATESVLPFSTGVIGEPLPSGKINAALQRCFDNLDAAGWDDAGVGIMTTDTRPKGASTQWLCGNKPVTISGIAKGAGMIKPDMATMLAYIATDAGLSQTLQDSLLKEMVDASFNRVTVDGDTSTNDSCMLIATNQAGVYFATGDEPGFAEFKQQLLDVFVTLAQAIIKDGEGATKFVTVRVTQAQNIADAEAIAYTVAHSPLVKTALFAGDPNWGRILAAIGRAPVAAFDVDAVTVYLDQVLLCEHGGLSPSYKESAGTAVMAQDQFVIEIRMGQGDASVDIWTCDFSYDYVKINADYRS